MDTGPFQWYGHLLNRSRDILIIMTKTSKMIKKAQLFLPILLMALLSCSSSDGGDEPVETTPEEVRISIVPDESHTVAYTGGSFSVTASASGPQLTAVSDASWLRVSVAAQSKQVAKVSVTADENKGEERTGTVTLMSGNGRKDIFVRQEAAPVVEPDPEEMTAQSPYVPDGYSLVWSDEFNTEDVPTEAKGWNYETGTGDNGWGNNELQYYIRPTKGSPVGFCRNGYMNIVAQKRSGRVESIRMNTTRGWQYAYIEARLKLPGGRGTWPAFWMLPADNDWTANPWPLCGEIDIMEEVGVTPNDIVSTLHADGHNHSNGTERGWTATQHVATAESDFHIYALLWTADRIQTFVDGRLILDKTNPGTGRSDWPYNVPFNIKLNLAWGGNWGGMNGVDELALPARYQIDYVRVYQK